MRLRDSLDRSSTSEFRSVFRSLGKARRWLGGLRVVSATAGVGEVSKTFGVAVGDGCPDATLIGAGRGDICFRYVNMPSYKADYTKDNEIHRGSIHTNSVSPDHTQTSQVNRPSQTGSLTSVSRRRDRTYPRPPTVGIARAF